jgi:thienamycin biosynthesis protein ThnN
VKEEDYAGWLQEILKIHFDPNEGAPYWLERAHGLGIDPRRDVRAVRDLACMGPMDEEALKERPIEDFVPRRYRTEKSNWVIGETGGTMGRPVTTVFLDDEFQKAFIDPFEFAARVRNFPRGENWLWVGPSGPHIIGKAAVICARKLGSPDPFSVDFDPRWVKKLAPNSIGFRRYFDHVLDQALRILTTQGVKVLFSTPKVLMELKELMPGRQREAILGVHFGGMELDHASFRAIAEAFPNAVFISGYGNTLFGMCPEFKGDPEGPLDYFPVGPRLVFNVVPLDPEMPSDEKLKHPCTVGQSGQIVFSRLDRSFLILNQFERDQGEVVAPPEIPGEQVSLGFGIRNPRSLNVQGKDGHVATGLY